MINQIWWNKYWGKWRYVWLEKKAFYAILNNESNNENIDDIYRIVFTTISFSQEHTDEELSSLIHSLEMHSTADIFSLETICYIANSIPENHSNCKKMWEIVYQMLFLENKKKYGMYFGLIQNTLNKLRILIPKIVNEPYLLFCVKLHDTLELRLNDYQPFSDDIITQINEARQKLIRRNRL